MLGARSFFTNVERATAIAAAFSAVMTLTHPTAAAGQVAQSGTQRVDSVVIEGNRRIAAEDVEAIFGIAEGSDATYRDIQRGIKALFRTGHFKDIVVRARTAGEGATLVVGVDERPLVRSVTITGLEHASERQARDTSGLRSGFPYSPQRVMDAEAFIRSKLAAEGIPFASIVEDQRAIPDRDNEIDLVLNVDEGHRVTIADVVFHGNEHLTDEDLRGAMSTRAEGFWWFRSGQYDESRFRADLEERLPARYSASGYLDFSIVSDTIIVDPQTGKARAEVTVDEGPLYRLASFTIEGNERFSDEDLEGFFQRNEGGLLQTLGIGGDDPDELDIFNAQAFNQGVASVREQYANEGYLYAQVTPVVTRNPATEEGEDPTVNASWEIREGSPAIVNRVTLEGNDYTHEWVVRDRIFILPGDVYSQERLLRSYQSIQSLGFFETPLPPPDIVPLENGDVDIVFHVTEKQTGAINFGTSVGGGVGVSGFLGYEQPNLFGQGKAGTVRWDFGRYVNAFEVSYSDPALFQSQISGSASLFNARDRFYRFSSGQRKRLGSSLRFGLPWPGSRVTRLFLGYGISRTRYEQFSSSQDASLFGLQPGVQSQVSLGLTRQTLDHPLFPTVGSRQRIEIEANGGLLGGDGNFTKLMLEGTWYVPVGTISPEAGLSKGPRFALGLTLKSGMVYGDARRFPFDRFWLGGVQFGQSLRGYGETTITPLGYVAEGDRTVLDIDRLANAFFSLSAEYALRLSDQMSASLFYDAGNVWAKPSQIDPTKLFRGAGFGVQLVTPFGPVGLDYAYGFDKPTPGWELHFKMGPAF